MTNKNSDKELMQVKNPSQFSRSNTVSRIDEESSGDDSIDSSVIKETKTSGVDFYLF